MKKIIHVNQHVIRANKQEGRSDPPLTVKTYKQNLKAHNVQILDKTGNVVAKIVYSPDKPLKCGARVWIETSNEVRVCGTTET